MSNQWNPYFIPMVYPATSIRLQPPSAGSNSNNLIELMEALFKDAVKKVFLSPDNLRVHHSNQVKVWLAERTQQIEVFYLPSYSPELIREERLNADLKQAMS